MSRAPHSNLPMAHHSPTAVSFPAVLPAALGGPSHRDTEMANRKLLLSFKGRMTHRIRRVGSPWGTPWDPCEDLPSDATPSPQHPPRHATSSPPQAHHVHPPTRHANPLLHVTLCSSHLSCRPHGGRPSSHCTTATTSFALTRPANAPRCPSHPPGPPHPTGLSHANPSRP